VSRYFLHAGSQSVMSGVVFTVPRRVEAKSIGVELNPVATVRTLRIGVYVYCTLNPKRLLKTRARTRRPYSA